MLKETQHVNNEMDSQFSAYVLVEDTFKCMICKFHHKIMSIIILAGSKSTKFMFKNCQKTNAHPSFNQTFY